MNVNLVTKIEKNKNNLVRFGFSFERGGVHTARTIMLDELTALLSFVDDPKAPKSSFLEAIQNANCLGKRSVKTRTLTFRHLSDLYGLDPNLLIFRALRFFWQRDLNGQPLLAALCAYCRDPIFRNTTSFVLGFKEGTIVSRESLEEFIDQQEPSRFSEATLKSTAQNINSSWTKAGHLFGRAQKVRRCAYATTGSVSFALLLGYINGLRGETLLNSEYTQLLDCSYAKTLELAEDASRRGWISLNRVGQIIEVNFPNLIVDQELEWLREQG